MTLHFRTENEHPHAGEREDTVKSGAQEGGRLEDKGRFVETAKATLNDLASSWWFWWGAVGLDTWLCKLSWLRCAQQVQGGERRLRHREEGDAQEG